MNLGNQKIQTHVFKMCCKLFEVWKQEKLKWLLCSSQEKKDLFLVVLSTLAQTHIFNFTKTLLIFKEENFYFFNCIKLLKIISEKTHKYGVRIKMMKNSLWFLIFSYTSVHLSKFS